MKPIYVIVFFLVSLSLFSQKAPILEPEIGKTYDFSQEKKDLWITCDSLSYNTSFKEKLTQQESNVLMDECGEIDYNESYEGMVSANHWTEEGYPYNQIDLTKAYNYAAYIKKHPDYRFTTASSALKSTSKNTYDDRNISDLSYQTAWVEGVKGYGIGEFVTFHFQPRHPRITTVIIANGYVKTKEAWKNNSRVKQLKMYLNNKPFAILNLKDVYADQTFKIPTIGYERTHDIYKDGTGRTVTVLDKKNNVQPSIIKFKILSVYKGDKYKDTAITEIYFDGLDVH